MADQAHLEILKTGVVAWNLWRKQHRSVMPDLTDASLIEADLSRCNLGEADLRGADLFGASLTEANLIGADLRGATLNDATLVEANLTEANLKEAWLIRANLSHAKGVKTNFGRTQATNSNFFKSTLLRARFAGSVLVDANLNLSRAQGADFTGAVLTRASLRQAELLYADFNATAMDGADLGEATIGPDVDVSLDSSDPSPRTTLRTRLTDIDLSTLRGLDDVNHWGPSDVSISTLESTRKGLDLRPERTAQVMDFLRRTGVSEELLASPDSNRKRYQSCFISYSSHDKEFAARLSEALGTEGVNYWLDTDDGTVGEPIHKAIDEAIRRHDRVIVVCSADSLNSKWVRLELDRAIKKELREEVTVIIPLALDGSIDDWDHPLSMDLKERIHADFSGWSSDDGIFDRGLAKILHALRVE